MKVGIIGGGACGLVLGRILQDNGIDYTILEKNKVGRKLLASGNGKANIMNTHIELENYNHPFGYEIVSKYVSLLKDFFKRIGLVVKEDSEGRVYPYSESSLSVLNCIMEKGLNIVENYEVVKINKKEDKWLINEELMFDYLVLATGSFAGMLPIKQEGYYKYLDSLKLKPSNLTPSLVGFRLKNPCRDLMGVRVKCRATLFQKDNLIHSERGEVIFKNDGISGICILNLSFYYAKLSNKKDCFIELDLLPDMELELTDKLELMGIFHPKLALYLARFPLKDMGYLLKHLRYEIEDTYDFEFSQAVHGGISLSKINPDLSLKEEKNIFIGGELLDIDGSCGGYNLMFAFCCGLKIGEKLCNIK